MSAVPVVTAISGAGEAALVAGLERHPAVRVARRCADVADLLASVAAGAGRAAVVSVGLRGLNAETISRLTAAGCAVVALADPPSVPPAGADPSPDGWLTRLGVAQVLAPDATPAEVAAAVLAACAVLAARPRPVDPFLGPDHPGDHPGRSAGPALAAGTRRDGSDDAALGLADPQQALARAAAGAGPRPSQVGAGRVVAVWGPAGAPGRTTIAVGLASELAAAGSTTLLVDADTYGACIAQTLGLLDETAGLAGAAREADRGRLDLAALARHAPLAGDHLRVLTGIARSNRWPELRAGALSRVFTLARELAAYTVVDAGFCLEQDEELAYDTAAPRRNAATLSALSAADVVVAVGSADPVGLQRLVRGLADLADLVTTRPVVVANRVRPGAVGARPGGRVREALDRYAGVRDPVLVPYDLESLDAAMLVGRTLTEHARSSPVRQALQDLVVRISAGPAGPNGPTGSTGPGAPGPASAAAGRPGGLAG